jgi:antitoxin component YwqK of YwqJK toxin-antitoxin module
MEGLCKLEHFIQLSQRKKILLQVIEIMVYRMSNSSYYQIFLSFLLLLLISDGCEKRTIDRAYYPSGKLEYKVEMINGLKDGQSFTYFENGNVKVIQEWKNDQPNGIGKHYYDNGKLKLMMEWKNGKAHGFYKEYYQSGNIKSEGLFIDDHEVGIHKFYYANGVIMEVDYYDSLGKALDYEKYDTLGNLRLEMKEAFTSLDKDTIRLGEQIVLTGYLGNNEHRVNMLVGKRYKDNGFLEDTIAVVYPKFGVDGCIFKYTPKEVGVGFLLGYMQESINDSDGSIGVRLFPFQEKYLVLKNED